MTENRYIAFLRGINISGKNKIAMSDLKREFENLGFTDVSTYLNNLVLYIESRFSNIKEILALRIQNNGQVLLMVNHMLII